MLNFNDIMETITMIQEENLDIRTITMGISLLDCADSDIDRSCEKIYNKIYSHAKDLVATGELIAKKYGIPIVNKRISVTPIAMLAAVSGGDPVKYAKTLDRAAKAVGVNFIGGYSALVQKGFSAGDRELIESIPRALAETDFVCSSVNIGSTKAGINMDAVRMMGGVIKEAAALTSDRQCIGAAKLVVFCNAPEDNPFMAGAFHGVGEPDVVLNVVVAEAAAVVRVENDLDLAAGHPDDMDRGIRLAQRVDDVQPLLALFENRVFRDEAQHDEPHPDQHEQRHRDLVHCGCGL